MWNVSAPSNNIIKTLDGIELKFTLGGKEIYVGFFTFARREVEHEMHSGTKLVKATRACPPAILSSCHPPEREKSFSIYQHLQSVNIFVMVAAGFSVLSVCGQLKDKGSLPWQKYYLQDTFVSER